MNNDYEQMIGSVTIIQNSLVLADKDCLVLSVMDKAQYHAMQNSFVSMTYHVDIIRLIT